jgi:amino acid transporter
VPAEPCEESDVSEASDAPTLRRAITPKLLLLFIVGDVLGAGIYALVGQIGERTGGAMWVPLVLAFLLAAIVAASYAELATRFPRAGGSAVYTHEAFGSQALSFLVGFAMLAAGITSVAALSLAFAGDYLDVLVDVPQTPVAIAFVVLIGLVNARGIKESLAANVAMTMIELSGLVLIVVLGFGIVFGGDGDPSRAITIDPPDASGGFAIFLTLLSVAGLAFYSYVGFETSANVVEETTDPQRSYPRALFGGIAIAGIAYALVGVAVAMAVPADRLGSTSGPFLEVIRASSADFPEWIFSAIALVAVANGALLTSIMASRLTYGMADDGMLPRRLATVLPGRRTPVVAIASVTVAVIIMLRSGGLATLAETTVLLLLFVFIAVQASVLRLPPRDDGDFYRAPRILPIVGIVMCLLLLTQQPFGNWVRAAIVMGIGGLAYLGQRALVARSATRPATA